MLKELFTEKRVPIINASFISEEDFITFAAVNKEYINEDGDYKWVPEQPVNGIIYSVQEHVIRTVNSAEEYTDLYMNSIIGSPTFDADAENQGYTILGIMKNAISKEGN
jgi:hypothetical protein